MLSLPLASSILLFLFTALLLFHLFVLFEIVPYSIIWAGKAKNRSEMLRMEIVSIIVTLLAATVVALHANYIPNALPTNLLDIAIWVLFAFFVLNTFGNLTAKHPLEKYGFVVLTAILALLLLNIALT
ncbi:MAG: hypothetical protein AAGI49_16175 [Bacteroidota bacterium]